MTWSRRTAAITSAPLPLVLTLSDSEMLSHSHAAIISLHLDDLHKLKQAGSQPLHHSFSPFELTNGRRVSGSSSLLVRGKWSILSQPPRHQQHQQHQRSRPRAQLRSEQAECREFRMPQMCLSHVQAREQLCVVQCCFFP